jgi:hypothetical protein
MMDPLESFLRSLLQTGRVRFANGYAPHVGPSPGSAAFLREAFQGELLDLAGPPLTFVEGLAVEAGALVHQACWALVDRGEPPEALARRLRLDRKAKRPEHHLAADLTLRYLAGVHRRARALDRDDPLATMLADLLRAWPLSGVLADLDEGPAAPPDLGDHPGVWMLYAERLARRDRPEWRPAGRGRDIVELVLDDGEKGRPRPRAAAVGVDHG